MSGIQKGNSGTCVPASTLSELAETLHVAGNALDSQVIASPVLGDPGLDALKQQLADIVTRLYGLENAVRRVEVSRRAAQGLD
jgi:hypothetical protein